MNSKLLSLCAVGAAMLLLNSGCQTGPTYKLGFDFSRYHTFAVLPLPTKGTYQDPNIATRLGPVAKDAIVETLSAKGFKQAPENEADFLVNVKFDYLPEEDRRTETRMMDLEMIDRQTKEVVWSTWGHRTTDKTVTPQLFRQEVARKLSLFPPSSRNAGH